MRDFERLIQLTRDAGAYGRERLPSIEPARRDSISFSQGDQHMARETLVMQRTGSTYYKDPNRQKRNVFRTNKQKAAKNDTSDWTFNKAERFAELDRQIRKGGAINLAHAILRESPNDPLDVNRCYIFDQQGQAVSTDKPNGWLDLVAERNDVDYVRLLAAFGASQQSKDLALSKALGKGALNAAQELLRSNADPNTASIEHFMNAISRQDTRLIHMFLTSMVPVHSTYINKALVATVGHNDVDLLALLFAHGASGEYAEGEALHSAIAGEHVEDVATILLHSMDVLTDQTLNKSVDQACLVNDWPTRNRFLELLLCAGADPNNGNLQSQLVQAVRDHYPPSVELLIRHGTSPDRNNAESLRSAIALGKTELVTTLLKGHISSASASQALGEAQALEETDTFEEVVTALVEKGVSQPSLGICLADAVEKGRGPLIAPLLIRHGANLEYDNAKCVRTALRQNNAGLLGVLLEAPCNPTVLSKTLPDAMRFEPRSERVHVLGSLLRKGASGREVHVALQMVSQDATDAIDYQMMDLLLRNKASVDFADRNGNCLSTATAQENEKALDLLIGGSPSPDTVSMALKCLPVSLSKSDAAEYEKFLRMAACLLDHGADGPPRSELFIQAVRDDFRGKMFELLLNIGADANYKDGKAVEEALRNSNSKVLEQICRRLKLTERTIAVQLPNALKPQGFSLHKATMLLHTAAVNGYVKILNNALIQEVKVFGRRREVLELLVRLGASADYQNGEVLLYAVSQGDLQTTEALLPATQSVDSIQRAFPSTLHIGDLPTRFAFMQFLLDRGPPGMGDEALIQTSREADSDDLSHAELLLQHKASPNYKDGAAVLESITAKNLPLLELYVRSKLNKTTLTNAFNLARKLECSQEERYLIYTILFMSEFKGFQTSRALIEAVQRLPTDVETSVLLLNHGASVDLQSGQAMQIAATSGSLELLGIFISKKPNQESRDATFHAAMFAPLDDNVRKYVYGMLLETGITSDLIDEALLEATSQKSVDRALLSLLVEHKASLDFEQGTALHNITERADTESLRILLKGKVTRKQPLNRSFVTCMALEPKPRLDAAKQLLEKKPGVDVDVISQYLALIARQQDHSLLDLLIAYKPDPAHNGGESVIIVAQTGDKVAMATLTKVAIPANVVNRSFESMLNSQAIQTTPGGLQTASILLSLGVEQGLLNRALLDAFDEAISPKTKELVELLIPLKPDFSDGNGKVLVAAARSGEVDLFKRMAAQKPDLNAVIPALIASFEAEAHEEEAEGSQPEAPSEHEESKETQPKADPTQNEREDNQPNIDPAQDEKENNQPQDASVQSDKGEETQPNVTPIQDEEVNESQSRNAYVEDEEDPRRDSGYDDNEADAAKKMAFEQDTHNMPRKDSAIADDAPEEKSIPEVISKEPTTPEEKLVFYLQHLESCAERGDQLLNASVIFTAITAFPEGVLLVRHLLDHGCAADSKIDALVNPSVELFRYEPTTELESLTVVMWALGLDHPKIGDGVILEVLKEGSKADPSHETSISHQSAMTMVSAGGRCAVLSRLLELGVSASPIKSDRPSASFFASRNGHKEAVEILHAGGAKTDDGSLQEAAREAHPDIVEFLLANGHRIDFPSGLHADEAAGRTPIEELCLHSSPGDDLDAWDQAVQKCIAQLLPKTVEDAKRPDGKTMLHLALENEDPAPVTRALLEFPFVWENINHPVHLFQDTAGHYRSPTKYTEAFCALDDADTQQQLLTLLRAKKCIDKFYAHTVHQPEGAIGLPEDIALAVDKHKRAEFEHDEALKRQQDLATRQRAIQTEDYNRKLARDKNRHDLVLRQQSEQEAAEKQIAQRKQAMARSHAQELGRERQQALIQENSLRQQALSEEASRRSAIWQQEQSAELHHKQSIAKQEYSDLQSKLHLEQQIANARNEAGKAEEDRVTRMLNKRQTTAKYEADQRIRAAQAAAQSY